MTAISLNDVNATPAHDLSAGLNEPEAASIPRALVGRQPILDRDLNVVGYELLFRTSAHEAPAPFDGNRATAEVIINTVTEIGLPNVVGQHPTFINFTDKLLIDGTARVLPQNHVVIEILEDVVVTGELTDALTGLVDAGYELALDDFVYGPKWDCLMTLASIIKIDVLALGREEVVAQVEYCKAYNVKLLAEKVETQAQFDEFFELGFDLFQGYFFAKPKVISQERLPENHVNLLHLLAKLQDTNASTSEIERLVSGDLTLSFKLLRYLNSAHFALPRKVDSIHRAVVYFGLDMLRRWAGLMAMANVDGKPSELLHTALVRARLCELLAERTNVNDPAEFFTVGLFSTLNALLDMPMRDVLTMLPLARETNDALTDYKGLPGEALSCALACEHSDWNKAQFATLKEAEIGNLYLESMQWAFEAGGSI